MRRRQTHHDSLWGRAEYRANCDGRLVLTPEDAEDVAQEILVKLITKLSTFDPGKAKFRTWLGRVVANHVLNMDKRGGEAAVTSFDACYGAIHGVPDEDPEATPELLAVVSGIATGCGQGVVECALVRRAARGPRRRWTTNSCDRTTCLLWEQACPFAGILPSLFEP